LNCEIYRFHFLLLNMMRLVGYVIIIQSTNPSAAVIDYELQCITLQVLP
jgi:hypothetical protein